MIYFKQFKLPKGDYYFWHLITETPSGKKYFIHTSGVVGVIYKNGKERLLKGYIKKGCLVVKINNKVVKVKNLVAKEMFSVYIEGKHSVINKDGNPRNCDCFNLKILDSKTLGRKTGGLANLSKAVSVDGVIYKSVRSASKALFCSYQTLLDYLSGKYKSSVLCGYKEIKYVK